MPGTNPGNAHVDIRAIVSTEQARQRIIDLYAIQVEGDTYTVPSEVEAVRLLNDSMQSACAVLYRYASDRDSRHQDDHEDYTNFARDMIVWALRVLHEELDIVAYVNRILAAHHNELEGTPDEDLISAHYDTPLTWLMHYARQEDDGDTCDTCHQNIAGVDDQNDAVPTR